MSDAKVIVRSGLAKVLLESNEANTIEFYDAHGDLCAVFTKVFDENHWMFSTKKDDDWDQALTRTGLNLKETTDAT